MTGARPAAILRQLEGPASTDRDLLARFVRERDQSAFKELIEKYGSVVLGVCRRVTGHAHDAEDAFQAVFLILARKAASIRKPEVIGSWLHGVALRVAQTARRSMLRRRVHEIAVSAMPERPAPATEIEPELSQFLDQELAGLPSWYRDAIVLCDLRGVSREEAASTLGVPVGTLSSRLTNGRKKLAERLTKRGITFSAVAIPMTLSASQATAVPAELIAKTCTVVADWASGGALPKPLAKLAEGGLSMRKTLMIGIFTTALAVAGVVYAAQSEKQTPAIGQQKPPVLPLKAEAAENPAPNPKPVDKPVVFASKPKLLQTIDVECSGRLTVAWNAQGTQLAIQNTPSKGEVRHLAVISMDTLKKRSFIPEESSQLVGFTPDGKDLVTEIREYELVSGIHRLDFWGEIERVVQSPAASGGSGAGVEVSQVKSIRFEKLRSLNLDLSQTQGFSRVPYVFLPDGKTFRTLGIAKDAANPGKVNLDVQDVDATSGKTIKSLLKATADSTSFRQLFSANGKKLAVIEQRDTVVVYDVERAAKLFTLDPSALRSKNLPAPVYPRNGGSIAAFQDTSMLLNFSANGSLLFVTRGFGVSTVFNGDTGVQLPLLEGTESFIASDSPGVFSDDGRLLALAGNQYLMEKVAGKEGGPGGGITAKGLGSALIVWETQTGKVLKTWNLSKHVDVAFNPVRPVLAVMEPNRNGNTRIGFWDFATETAEKK